MVEAAGELPHWGQLREALGRLLVWTTALDNCERALELSIKASSLQDRSTSVNDVGFSRAELDQLSTLLPTLAAVEFATVFNAGYGHEGVVAGNKAAVSDRLRDLVVKEAFRPRARRARFQRLVTRVTKARDQIIAHRDAAGLQMSHTRGWPPRTQWAMPFTGIHDLSLKEWLDDVKVFQSSLAVVLDAIQNGIDPTDPEDIPIRRVRVVARA